MRGSVGTEPFRSRANSLPGANRPIGPWPIRSLALSLPGLLAPWNFRSLNVSIAFYFRCLTLAFTPITQHY